MGLEIALVAVGCLIAVVAIISLVVSIWLSVRYSKFNRCENSAGLTGMQIARRILDDNGLSDIAVSATGSIMFGNSYSHYFKKVRIRRLTRHETSITSLGIGAQKASLAILAKEGDVDMKRRIRLVPLITFGPFAFIPLVVVGAVLDYYVFSQNGICTFILGGLGLLFYVYSIVLSVMTLKTERKAQDRAYEILRAMGIITDSELDSLKDLFHLYNVQYINDIILASLELVYNILKIAVKLKGDKR